MFKTFNIDDRLISYGEHTVFLVQVGRGRGSYRTVARFMGSPMQAVMHYRMINLGNGYKKRLLIPLPCCSCCPQRPTFTVARDFSL